MSMRQQLEAEGAVMREIKPELPEGWIPFRYSTSDEDCPKGFVRIVGAVVPANITRGPNQGKINWKSEVAGSRRVVFLTRAEWSTVLQRTTASKEAKS